MQNTSQTSGLDWLALVLLPFGGLVIPVAGWILGVVLLWRSAAWTVRDKVLGTIVWPGGYFLVSLAAINLLETGACGSDQACTDEGSWLTEAAFLTLYVAVAAAPLAVMAYLGVRLTKCRRTVGGATTANG